MATRQEYTSCVGQGMRGKQLSKPERQLEFCVVSKLCSKKAGTREEAIRLCSLPKESKPQKARSIKPDLCEKDAVLLAHCIAEKVPDIEEDTIADAVRACRC